MELEYPNREAWVNRNEDLVYPGSPHEAMLIKKIRPSSITTHDTVYWHGEYYYNWSLFVRKDYIKMLDEKWETMSGEHRAAVITALIVGDYGQNTRTHLNDPSIDIDAPWRATPDDWDPTEKAKERLRGYTESVRSGWPTWENWYDNRRKIGGK